MGWEEGSEGGREVAHERPIAKGFGDMVAGDTIGLVEIRDGTRDAQDAVVGARGEPQSIGGAHKQDAGVGIELRGGCDQAYGCRCVGVVRQGVERVRLGVRTDFDLRRVVR